MYPAVDGSVPLYTVRHPTGLPAARNFASLYAARCSILCDMVVSFLSLFFFPPFLPNQELRRWTQARIIIPYDGASIWGATALFLDSHLDVPPQVIGDVQWVHGPVNLQDSTLGQ